VLLSEHWPFLELHENPGSRECAQAENDLLEVARHTRDVLAPLLPQGSFPDDSLEDELVDAAPLRAALRAELPEGMDAAFLERTCRPGNGIYPRLLFRIRREGSRTTRRNFERVALAIDRQDLIYTELPEPPKPIPVDEIAGIPIHEIAGCVLMAVGDLHRRGKREAAKAAWLWHRDYARRRERPLSDLPDEALETTLLFFRALVRIADGAARATPVTAAAIRKRRSRRSNSRA
jgi:hypothetical protein